MDQGAEYYRRYLAGDETGFDQLMELYRENLIFFLLRFLPSVEDAEDAAEDAFVELLLHRWREDGGASLKTYLFTIGKRKALSHLHRRGRRKEQPLSPLLQAEALSLEDRVCRDEERRELVEAIRRLPEQYQEALYLLYFEGLTLDEVAKVMGKNKKQVENLSYRGKQALKQDLGKEARR